MNITFNKFTKSKYPYLDDSYIDNYIPVAYGKIASVKLTPINSNYDTDNGNVAAVYRMPDGMTNYGTAYVKVDDTWVAATVSSVDYDTGLITISNGRASSGSTYTCKLTDCYGYMFDGHCYPRQALQHWYATYGNIQYTDSNFNKTEWVAALDDSRYQADFGLLLDDYGKDEDSDNTYDLDYFKDVVYNIATFGGKMYCRVDYDLSGKITATLKDYDRTASDTIASADIYDNNTLSASTTKDSAFTSIIEKYYHNTVDDNYLSLEDNTYEKYVKQNYRIMQSKTDISYLVNEADAKTRAAELALEYKHIPVEFTINVRERYTTRLYDVVTVALMPDNLDSSMRQYAGNKDCLVTGVAPLPDKGYTTLAVQIIPDRTASTQQASIRNSAFTTVSREKSATQIITDNLQNQITDNLLLTGNLSVPSISLSATSSGVVSDYSAATGTFYVMYNGTDITGDGPVYSVVSQTNCVGTINADEGIYAVTQLNADVGILLLKATYAGKSIETSFTVTKSKNGADGSSTRISINTDSSIIVRKSDGTFNPSTLTVSATSTTGDVITSYSGRFKIYAGGSLVYTSSSDETEYTYTIPTGVSLITIELYESGGTTTLYDTEKVPVLEDGTAITIVSKNDGSGYQVSSDGVLASSVTQTTEITAYKGKNKIDCIIGTLPTVAGFELSKTNNTVTIKALAGSAMAETGKIIIPVYLLDYSTAKVIGDASTPWVIGDASTPWILGDFEADTSYEYSVTFDYWKSYAGINGTDGTDAATFNISADVSSFSIARSGALTPGAVTFTATKVTNGTSSAYAGRFIIYETTDGSTWVSKYTSSSDESSKAYIPTNGILGVKAELYYSGGTNQLLSSISIPATYSADVAPEYLGAKSTMPTTSIIKGDTVLWIGSSGTYTPGKVYKYDGSGSWSVLDYTDTANSSYYMAALKDILSNYSTGSGYFDAVFCNVFFASSASISALQTKTITLTTSGVIKSANYVAGSAGFKIQYDGTTDFNGNTHIGGTLTVDGVATLGSRCVLQGPLAQGTAFYIGTRLIIRRDNDNNFTITSSNSLYTENLYMGTGVFAIKIPAAHRAYGIPRVIRHYAGDWYSENSVTPTLSNIMSYKPGSTDPSRQLQVSSGINVFRTNADGTYDEFMPLYFTDNQVDQLINPYYALLTLIYI